MDIDDEEEWSRVKMGRLNDADERIVEGIMGNRFKWFSTSYDPTPGNRMNRKGGRDFNLPGRARTQSLGYAHHPCKQVVVKVRLCPKSLYGAKSMIHYVARVRPQDKRNGEYGSVPLRDEFGVSVSPNAALALTDSWELTADEVNLSKTARDYLEKNDLAAFHAMDGRDRLRNIQVWHFVLSIKEDGSDESVADSFCAAVRSTVDEIFTANGYKVLWALHKGHTDRLHAHVIVRARSTFGRMLSHKIYGYDFHIIRGAFAQNLRHAGLDYGASRRIDRTPLREQVMAAIEPLKNGREVWMNDQNKYVRVKMWGAFFGERALENIDRLGLVRNDVQEVIRGKKGKDKYAAAIVAIREKLDLVTAGKPSWGERLSNIVLRKPDNDTVPKQYAEVYEALEYMFHDPEDSFISWLHMAGDGAHINEGGKEKYPFVTFANWNLRCRPEVFGRVKSSAFEFANDTDFKKMLGRVKLPPPERFPCVSHESNAFLEHMETKRIHKDRGAAMTELRKFYRRLEVDWPGSWWIDTTDTVIRQTARVEVGQKVPEVRMEEVTHARENASILNTELSQGQKSEKLASPSVPRNDNDVNRDMNVSSSAKPQSNSKKLNRGR